MLQSTFLPASELGCTSVEREAAIEVLHQLESGQIRSMSGTEFVLATMFDKDPKGDVLYMSQWCNVDRTRDSPCGTCCCLGGWIEIMLGRAMHENMSSNWHDVFYPAHWDDENISTKIAAKALRAKLETGKADWT